MSLKVKISRGLLKPPLEVEEIQSIALFDENDQPLFAAVLMNDNSVLTVSPSDKNFKDILTQLGIDVRCDYEVV